MSPGDSDRPAALGRSWRTRAVAGIPYPEGAAPPPALSPQAVEVFDADWIQWEGLRDSLPNGHAAPAPALAAGPVPAALGALQELRRGLPKLPPAQLVHVRAECKALLEALDAHGAPRA